MARQSQSETDVARLKKEMRSQMKRHDELARLKTLQESSLKPVEAALGNCRKMFSVLDELLSRKEGTMEEVERWREACRNADEAASKRELDMEGLSSF